MPSGYYVNFWGFEGRSYYSIYSSGIFGLFLTIDGVDYTALFNTSGTLKALSR